MAKTMTPEEKAAFKARMDAAKAARKAGKTVPVPKPERAAKTTRPADTAAEPEHNNDDHDEWWW